MGNDFFETIEEMIAAEVPLGIGRDCYVEYAIIDKNARIGNNVYIRGSLSLPDSETDTHCIRDGIVVVKKGAMIADGTRIGLGA
jgi:glucose-1-phosphate adenylyltransferase